MRTLRKKQMERFRQYCSYLPTVVPDPMFVKVGAHDGITGDPCSDILLAETRWKGLLIEPVPHCFDRLRANFHDEQRFSVEQIAISATAREAPFYYVNPKAREILKLPNWFDQIGSLKKNGLMKIWNGVLAPFIVECKVEVRPLADLLSENEIRDVHLLHIDTEGHDYEVLKSLDFADLAPVVIFVEHKCLSDTQKAEMLHFLRRQGYSVYNCGGDYFALDKKAYKRLQRTALPRRR